MSEPKTLNDYSVAEYGPCWRGPDCRLPDGHGGVCEPREEPLCAVCKRTYFIESTHIPGLCRTCGFVAHCEGY